MHTVSLQVYMCVVVVAVCVVVVVEVSVHMIVGVIVEVRGFYSRP